ncbi:hypothetical protein SAMN05216227_1001158 [Pseudorhodobacter antarcticus]|jgi:hypothetical protein|uniref:Uncharacterized protein n=1 Tax=Pseudorhodobacter antarcticus TaxID=1077947 RepID=A0A1H8AIR6_9RHOB|nr:hypothetical protein [Pseudorhodobacter antarcticus]SEM70665.1 hypothetical protein SAMN05216227_1001158 [Pseudorhodobacter antarcticus]
MTLLILATTLLAALAFVSLIAVPIVTRPASLFAHGPMHARIKGIALCAITATAAMFAANPDNLTDLTARAWESLGLAGFSATFWLPWFLFAFGRAADKVRANSPRNAK